MFTGLCGAALVFPFRGETIAVSFLCACLWLALNTILLARLLETLTLGGSGGTGLALLLACAKIPLSYAILFWLFQVQFLDKWGLTGGVLSLPLVVLARGLAVRQHSAYEVGKE